MRDEPRNDIFYSDIDRVKQILMNLISNSFKFTQKGAIVVTISKIRQFNEQTWEHSIYLEFKVKDTGQGIRKEAQKDLFKMFGKLKQSNKSINANGTGLGLTICKKLTESLGGKIKLESEQDKGTEVIFRVQNLTDHEEIQPEETKKVEIENSNEDLVERVSNDVLIENPDGLNSVRMFHPHISLFTDE